MLEAELYRLNGELLLQKFKRSRFNVQSRESAIAHSPIRNSKPEECFLKALDISRKQQAKSLELRAVMSLVRLRQQQVREHATRTTHHEVRNRLNEAHQMLSEIYNWFTEGFDTKDLQEAKALLDEITIG